MNKKTYNFIQACNLGKMFKFAICPQWYANSILNGVYNEYNDTETWFAMLNDHDCEAQMDIINGEFELKEQKIEITEDQLKNALDNVSRPFADDYELLNPLRRELGFKDE